MIPLTFLYDEYIDRPKLSEQKKPFEYIVLPPQVGPEQLITHFTTHHTDFAQNLKTLLKGEELNAGLRVNFGRRSRHLM